MVKKKQVPTEATSRNVRELTKHTSNIYESIIVIGKRAKEVSKKERDELHKKLEEFAPSSDSLEEVFENKEQIEISTYYEKKPKPSLVATEQYIHKEFDYTITEKDHDH